MRRRPGKRLTRNEADGLRPPHIAKTFGSKRSTHMSNPNNPTRSRIINAINGPLGFFVLTLLIVAVFWGTGLVGTEMESNDFLTWTYLGVSKSVLVVAVVSVLVWAKPDNLTFDKSAHLSQRITVISDGIDGNKRRKGLRWE